MNRLVVAICILLLTAHAQQSDSPEEQNIQQLELEIESLNPMFLEHFVEFYHLGEESTPALLDHRRITMNKGAYFMLLGKMYLYKMLPNHDVHALRVYNTKSDYAASYYYLKLAA